MPNHIINTIRLKGDRQKISELLESVKDNKFGIGSLDFNKVIPMPESLQIETSSSMERGLKAYKEFVDICTFDGANKDMDLLNNYDLKKQAEENNHCIMKEAQQLSLFDFQYDLGNCKSPQ